MKPAKKDLSVETLRGFAIVFMVAGHIIGSNLTGMKVTDDSGWSYFFFSFLYLRMPLFTVISGYVYSLRPTGNSTFLSFIKGKSRRLLLPLLSVATLHFLIQHFVPGTNNKLPLTDMWQIYILPYGHFWFLQSIFLIFVTIGLIDQFKLMLSFRNWLIIFISASLLRFFIPEFSVNYFGINGFFNLLPFFVLGCGIQRFNSYFTGKIIIRSALAILVISIILQQYTWFAQYIVNDNQFKILSLLEACSGIILLFYIKKNITVMSKIGYYAFGIYLFHVFGTAGSRIILMKCGMNNHFVLFTIGLIFGLGIPIAIESILEKSKNLRRLFLGLR